MRFLTEIHPEIDFTMGYLVLVNKPLDWTSFDVVKKLRGTLCRFQGIKKLKVGHAGTLDPLATGLLLIATGKYTKLLHDLQNENKIYEGSIKFGASTTTYDAEGEEIPGADPGRLTFDDAISESKQFIGDIMQVPPIYSAIKIKGQKAYSIARRGKSVDMPPRPVRIDCFELKKNNWPVIDFKVECSKGTYIRSLAHDLGQALGTGGYLTRLVRTRIGQFCIEDAWDLAELVGELTKED